MLPAIECFTSVGFLSFILSAGNSIVSFLYFGAERRALQFFIRVFQRFGFLGEDRF